MKKYLIKNYHLEIVFMSKENSNNERVFEEGWFETFKEAEKAAKKYLDNCSKGIIFENLKTNNVSVDIRINKIGIYKVNA